MQSFSITEALSFGFHMFVRNFWLLLGLSLLGAAVQFGAGIVSKMIVEKSGLSMCHPLAGNRVIAVEESGDFVTVTYNRIAGDFKNLGECFNSKNIALTLLLILINLLAGIFAYVLFMGWNRIALDLFDRGHSEVNRIFVTLPLFLSYFIGGILYSLIVSFGTFLLIIPGIIWALKYGFFDLMIIDTDCGPMEALSKSGSLTYGHKWQLFWFALISMAILFISAITIIGPFILAYVLFLSRAYIFRTLQGKKIHA